jgi:hypothetical protein
VLWGYPSTPTCVLLRVDGQGCAHIALGVTKAVEVEGAVAKAACAVAIVCAIARVCLAERDLSSDRHQQRCCKQAQGHEGTRQAHHPGWF